MAPDNIYTTNDHIILLLNTLETNRRCNWIVYTNISYDIHKDVNSSSHLRILPSYYLHRRIECPLGLSRWLQIKALDTILLNWSIQTSSTHILRWKETFKIFFIVFIPVAWLYKYSETSIYCSQIIRFPGYVVQFLWSLRKSYLNCGNKTLINHSSSYRFPASVGQNF
jgi:hypothetical protein